MNPAHARNLDLNLLRVFVAVASTGSVTRAAAQLYVTQSAVSAALRRLTDAVGARLFMRHGRGITLTARGQALLARARPHLESLIEAVAAPAQFDPATSDRTLRLGLADGAEGWLLSPLLCSLGREAPNLHLVVLPVQFRTVGEALATRAVDLAVTVADELPRTVRRQPLLFGEFVCLFDPRHARVRSRLRERDYFALPHVIVSYNGDLRGIVEDSLGKQRRVRCSVPSFASVGAAVEGGDLLATVPRAIAEQILTLRPRLRVAPLPFPLRTSPIELLWPAAADDDPAAAFLRDRIAAIAGPRSRARAHPAS